MADQSRADAAHAEFKKVQKAQDAKKAMSEYEADAAAVRAKTARLKAARLAQEAAQAAAPKPAAARKKRSAKKESRTSATLSDWLKDQAGSGRNS